MPEAVQILTFDSLPVHGHHPRQHTEIDGLEWHLSFWGNVNYRSLQRELVGCRAEINEVLGGRYILKIRRPAGEGMTVDYTANFDGLATAVAAADAFVWETRDQGGITWYRTGERSYTAVLGPGDTAEIGDLAGDGRWSISRSISPRRGEIYKIDVIRYDGSAGDLSVRGFAEAAAIATTIPKYLSVLAARSP